MPYRHTPMHFAAIYRDQSLLKKCFDAKVPFTADIDGKTPLDYAQETKD